jgi:glutamyl-tRNA synthetase
LPQALINALARVGWSYGDQEKFTISELIEKFSLENVGKAAGIFNTEKLLDLNAQYIRESGTEALARDLIPFLEKQGFTNLDHAQVMAAVETLKPRSKTLVEMAENARFYFVEDMTYDPGAAKKFLKPDVIDLMKDIRDRIGGLMSFTQSDLEKVFLDFIEEKGIKLGRIAQPLRIALTGTSVSPGLFEVMEVLGKEKILRRIDKALEYIRIEKVSPGGTS